MKREPNVTRNTHEAQYPIQKGAIMHSHRHDSVHRQLSSSHMRAIIARLFAALVILLTVAGPIQLPQAMAAPAGQSQGSAYLPTNGGPSVSAGDLKKMIDHFIPTNNAQSALLIFTQCYGGEMAGAFAGRANTAVLAATASGCSLYQGYHDDAARALKPGEGRTSDDVHNAGVAGKGSSENPTKSGDPVSLAPVTADGPIRSRHVLVYAGKPEALDVADRDAIKKNFAGQLNTTVTTVGDAPDSGGKGQHGWDYPGTGEGLRQALKEIGQLMNPHEQFILFVTDHGGMGKVESTPACKDGQCVAEPIPLEPELWELMWWDQQNTPEVILTVEQVTEVPVTVNVNGMAFPDVLFDQPLHLDGDDQPDGWQAVVLLPEDLLARQPVSITTQTPVDVQLTSLALVSGALQRPFTIPHGTLATSSGPSIYDFQVRQLIDQYIPTNKAQSSLLIFTQCFGGDMVDDFAGRANTAVLSATSPGQKAYYNGYDDDAAKALTPGAGRTSDDVHKAGVAGKNNKETPTQSGDPVSLEPVTENGTIRSRHVLVYAGRPNGVDEQIRQTIENNFAGQPNTTVTTVGKDGTGGWDHPGTLEGLRKGLEEIGKMMNPNEQFIFFVTDHGDYDIVDHVPQCNSGFCMTAPLAVGQEVYDLMLADPDNTPGVTLHMSGLSQPVLSAVVSVGSHQVQVNFDRLIDLNGDGLILGPGEGIQAFAPLPEELIDPAGLRVAVNLGQGRSASAAGLEWVALESGELAKGVGMFSVYLPHIEQ